MFLVNLYLSFSYIGSYYLLNRLKLLNKIKNFYSLTFKFKITLNIIIFIFSELVNQIKIK